MRLVKSDNIRVASCFSRNRMTVHAVFVGLRCFVESTIGAF